MCVMKEVWKDITGYEGYYQISNLGRVKSLERDVYSKDGLFRRHKEETIKIPKKKQDGYLCVTLSVNGKNKTFSVHVLVATAFVEKPLSDERLEVNHIDMNRTNNCAWNLEWVTHKDNVRHSSAVGKYSVSKIGTKNGRSVPIRIVDPEKGIDLVFGTKMECAEWMKEHFNLRFNVNGIFSGITKSIQNGRKYRGFIVNYV